MGMVCCLTSCFIFSSLLSRVCVVSPHSSLVQHCLSWFVLFHLMLHWFIIPDYGLYCFTSCFTGSFLLAIVCIFFTFLTGSSILGMIFTVSFSSLVLHYWAWFIRFHFMLHWFIPTGQCLYFLTSLTGSSLLA
jgi:hypothetical protein